MAKLRILKKPAEAKKVAGIIKIKVKEPGELKNNIKIKEVKELKKEEIEGADTQDKNEEKKPGRLDFISEERAESKPVIPIIRTDDISPVRTLDEVSETPRNTQTAQAEQRNVRMYSEREPSKEMTKYVEATSLGDVRRADAETRRIYNPERTQAPRIVEQRAPESRFREANIRNLRPELAPSAVIEEKREIRNPRTEIEQIRGFYKEYEDVRKYEEREKEPKERRRRI
ncbi:hypothetical protein HYV49_05465 [Candidatus Pacearchaeota archaeon]|nr:hypothetical protein [Candidatus Pacearchaeota archaeon]